MGMFDYIRCEQPLPAPNTEGMTFQTKDLDCDLDELLIKADGTLWRIKNGDNFSIENPLGHLADYFGEVRFYHFTTSKCWVEFRARFVDGKLHGPIVLIQDDRPSGVAASDGSKVE